MSFKYLSNVGRITVIWDVEYWLCVIALGQQNNLLKKCITKIDEMSRRKPRNSQT